ncbi:hypothetical protein ACIBJF_50620 [Streptomyces sp. NPDC050743]|uniref:hypothetical protein n=1 Tax=Streptomyces sp. NPDC050743 TaxID=3365634 RepID=UPI00379D852E
MGDPLDPRGTSARGTSARGTSARGTANRIDTPTAPLQDYPPFDVRLLFGQESIPNALAYALKWQIELDRQQANHPEPTEAQQELAKKLLALFDFLLIQEQQVQRDPVDGALLYRDPIKQSAATPLRNPRLVDVGFGEMVPVTDDVPDAPLPAWAPSIYPREFGADGQRRYPSRPRRLTEIPPFDSPLILAGWLRLRDWRPAPPVPAQAAPVPTPQTTPGPTLAAEPRPPKPVDKKALNDTLNRVVARYGRFAAVASRPYTPTPLVDNAIHQLSNYTLADLRTATGAKIQSTLADDDKLIEHTSVILYHSVFTVVLDQAGNPFDLRYVPGRRGLLDYALLVPEPGSPLRRALPNPGGVNVNVQPYGDTTFRIEKGHISKVPVGGIGSFATVGIGAGRHPVLEPLDQFWRNYGGYIASVSAGAAFHPADADLGRIDRRLGDLVEAATPHVLNEVRARLKDMAENWQELLEGVVWEAIKNEIRDWIVQYVIKKIGEHVVPVIKDAFALYDLATGSAARTRVRYAIACAMLAVKGTTDEDTELAAKVMAKIVADEFDEEIIQAATRALGHAVKKVVRHAAPKVPSGSPPNTPPPPPAQTPPGKPDAPNELAPKPTQPAPPPQVHESAVDAEARRQFDEYVRQRLTEAIKPPPAKATTTKATPGDAATGDTAKGKTDPATSNTATTHTGTVKDPVVDEIVEGIKEAPTPQPGRYVGTGNEPRAKAGESTMGFAYGEKGFAFLEGPSGGGGHAWNAGGFDGVAFRTAVDGKLEVRIPDNKANYETKNVSDASAITTNLAKNLEKLANKISTADYDTVPRISELRKTLNAAAAAAKAGQPLPSNVTLDLTTFAGNSKGITGTLGGKGVTYKGTDVD